MSEVTFEQELDFAAGEAVFGMQLNRKDAVKFVLNNVSKRYVISREQAEKAVEEVMTEYKISLGQ